MAADKVLLFETKIELAQEPSKQRFKPPADGGLGSSFVVS
jgi:hypothetical protein